MTYFAKINPTENPNIFIVSDVIRASQEVIDSGDFGNPQEWVETSYNTYGGIYYIPNSNPLQPDPDQSKELRANYASIGYTYDKINDVFYAPQPAPDWTIGPPSWIWQNPNPPQPISSEFTIFVNTGDISITI